MRAPYWNASVSSLPESGGGSLCTMVERENVKKKNIKNGSSKNQQMSKDINEVVLTEMSRHVLCTTTNTALLGNINNTRIMHHDKHSLIGKYK